jgi:hypothetical protein
MGDDGAVALTEEIGNAKKILVENNWKEDITGRGEHWWEDAIIVIFLKGVKYCFQYFVFLCA